MLEDEAGADAPEQVRVDDRSDLVRNDLDDLVRHRVFDKGPALPKPAGNSQSPSVGLSLGRKCLTYQSSITASSGPIGHSPS